MLSEVESLNSGVASGVGWVWKHMPYLFGILVSVSSDRSEERALVSAPSSWTKRKFGGLFYRWITGVKINTWIFLAEIY